MAAGYLQCVVFKKEVAEETWNGGGPGHAGVDRPRHRDRRGGGARAGRRRAQRRGRSSSSAWPKTYPITPKEHGTEFLMEHRHLWLRSSKQHAVLRVRNEVEKAIRDFFYDRDFVLIDSPILTANAAEGTSTLFETDYFGEKAYLSQSGQLYLEPAAAAFGKVYCFGPTFRAEKSKTRRHLMEFWMVEPEVAFLEFEGLQELAEEFVDYLVGRALDRCAGRAEDARARHDQAREREAPLPAHHLSRGHRAAAIEGDAGELRRRLRRRRGDGHRQLLRPAGDDHAAIRPPSRPSTCSPIPNDPDGRARPRHDRARGLRRDHRRLAAHPRPRPAARSASRSTTCRVEAFQWYLDVRKYGTFPHSGFGMGIERCVAWISGVPHLRETIPYPRMLNRIYP